MGTVRLLVCGPRNLDTTAIPAMVAALDAVLTDSVPYVPGFVLAHGAALGADFLWEDALEEVVRRDTALWLPVRRMPARWTKDGRASWAAPEPTHAGPGEPHLLARGALGSRALHSGHL